MSVKEFLKARSSVFVPEDVGTDEDLSVCKFVNVPVITPNGVMVSVQKRIKYEELNVPYTMYSNDFMQKNGVKQLRDVPLSSFAVFDAIKQVINDSNPS